MKTFVIGDIHGNYKGLKQALERSSFDYEKDVLISLGDVVDGHSDSFEVVEELLKVKHLIAIKGNHDDWFNYWIHRGVHPVHWLQGAKATGESYLRYLNPEDFFLYDYSTGNARVRLTSVDIPESHKRFFSLQRHYYEDEKGRLFVHGGFDRTLPISEQGDLLWWDRKLWDQALSWESTKNENTGALAMVDTFTEIFIGHTSTQFWGMDTPMHAANIWNLDTGGGWFGFVTVMDVDTKEFWQSDSAKELYPNFRGR